MISPRARQLRPLALAAGLALAVLALPACDEAGSGASGGAPAAAPWYPELAENTRLVSRFNRYAADGYSNCWGYTAPDGREYALLGARSGTSVVDLSDAANPREAAFIPGPFSHWREIKAYRDRAYVVTEAGGGIQIIDLRGLPATATLAATFTGINRAHTVTIDEARGILYTGGGEARSSHAFSLADPDAPAEIGVVDSPYYVHDQTMAGTRGYLAEGGSGTFSVLDLADPSAPALLLRWDGNGAPVAAAGPAAQDEGHGGGGASGAGFAHNIWPIGDGSSVLTTEETTGRTVKRWLLDGTDHVHLTGEYLGPNRLAHNVHVKGGYAYLAHYGAGLRILSLADPAALPEAGAWRKEGTQPEGFAGVWGVYPYFDSGNILLSDIEDGLFVVHFAGAER